MRQTTLFHLSAHRLFTILLTALLVGFSQAQEAPEPDEEVVLELGHWKVTHTDEKPLVDFGNPPVDQGLATLWKLTQQLLIACGIIAVLIVVLMRFLPDHPLVKRWMLPNVTSGDAHVPVSASGGASVDESSDLLGLEGIAKTDLRPTGKGLFGERMLDVISDAEFIADGAKLRVVATEGTRVVVEVAS